MGLRVGGSESQHFAEGSHSAFWIAASLEQEAEARLDERNIGLKFDGMFVGAQRLIGIGFCLLYDPSVIPGRRILGIELQCVVQHLLRFFRLTLAGECRAQMEIGRLVVWVESQSFLEFAFGLAEPRLLSEQRTQLVMQFGFARCEHDGLLEFSDSVVRFILQSEGASERLMSLPLLGGELYGNAELGNGIVESAFGFERLREVGMGDGQRGLKFDHSAKADDGIIHFALL